MIVHCSALRGQKYALILWINFYYANLKNADTKGHGSLHMGMGKSTERKIVHHYKNWKVRRDLFQLPNYNDSLSVNEEGNDV